MSQRISLRAALLAVVVCAGLGGCVERRYLIMTDQPGATVFENGKAVGVTPLDRPFTYYGIYRFSLEKDGFQRLVVDERIKTPWYEYFPVDFISENLIPWTIRDVRQINYSLTPQLIVPAEVVLERGGQLREKGKSIGTQPVAPGQPVVPMQPLPGQPVVTPSSPTMGADTTAAPTPKLMPPAQ